MSTTTYDLDAAVAAVAQANRERKAAEVQKREETERKKAAAKVAFLQQFISESNVFTAKFTNATHMRITSDSQYGRIELDYLGEWHLSFDGVNRFDVYYPNGSRAHTGVFVSGVSADLEQKLLAAFADWREAQDVDQEHQQRLARQQAECEAETAACEAEIAAAKAEGQAALWQWPDGVSITLYHWRWQDGRDSGGDPTHDNEWSSEDRLDENGYITFLPNGKRLRLIPDVHLPIVEAVPISAAADLPHHLRYKKSVTLDGIWSGWGEQVEGYYHRYQSDEQTTLTVGYEPHEAIRNMIEETSIPF